MRYFLIRSFSFRIEFGEWIIYPRTYHIACSTRITGLAIAVFVVSSSCVRSFQFIHRIGIVRGPKMLHRPVTRTSVDNPRRIAGRVRFFECSSFAVHQGEGCRSNQNILLFHQLYWFLTISLEVTIYHLPPDKKICRVRLDLSVSTKLFSAGSFLSVMQSLADSIQITLSFSFLFSVSKKQPHFYVWIFFYLCMHSNPAKMGMPQSKPFFFILISGL